MTVVLKLKKRKDFLRVAKQGQKMVTSTVILQAAQSLSAPEQNPKTGFTTTRKIGKAHIRNRARRRMRPAFETRLRICPDRPLQYRRLRFCQTPQRFGLGIEKIAQVF